MEAQGAPEAMLVIVRRRAKYSIRAPCHNLGSVPSVAFSTFLKDTLPRLMRCPNLQKTKKRKKKVEAHYVNVSVTFELDEPAWQPTPSGQADATGDISSDCYRLLNSCRRTQHRSGGNPHSCIMVQNVRPCEVKRSSALHQLVCLFLFQERK